MKDQKMEKKNEQDSSDLNHPHNELLCYQPEIFISEYVPTGPTQSNIFWEELKIPYGKRKSMFLARQQEIDRTPEKMTTSTSSGLAEIRVKDISETEVQFTFQIFFPKKEVTKQSEEIGCTIKQNGEISYGTKITEINGKKHQKMDLLNNLLVGLSEDTSKAMYTLLSSYQRRILDIVYPKSGKGWGRTSKNLCNYNYKNHA